MSEKIDTVAARAKLAPRREPYWQRIAKGAYLGVRRMSVESEGTWIARAVDATGKKPTRALGTFDEVPEGQRFDAACKAASEWFAHLGKGGASGVTTVRDVCRNYVEHVRSTKTERAADDLLRRHEQFVLSDARLAATDVTKLTPAEMAKWRKYVAEMPATSGPNRGGKRSEATLGRDLTCLRAALNLAFEDGLVTSDFAWRSKLKAPKDTGGRRELYLDRVQRRALIDAARADLGQFLHALSLLPLRPGALAQLTAGDYDRRLQVIKIGKDKAGKDRKFMLPEATAEIFAAAVKDKLPGAPLLSRENGEAWDKDAWKRMIKTAATASGLPPETTAYTLRHSTITDLVADGTDLLTVAKIAGTSVLMIDKHYGHLRSDIGAAALAKLAL